MPPRKSRPTAKGNCYEAAGKYLLDACVANPKCGLTLVYGEVSGQGPLEGLTYGHAWVLDGDTVIDVSNGRNLRLPRVVYYALGGIDRIGNVHDIPGPKRRNSFSSTSIGARGTSKPGVACET